MSNPVESPDREIFSSADAIAYHEAIGAYRTACERSADGDHAVRRARKLTSEVLGRIPLPGPNIRNWEPTAASTVADQYELLAASYKEAAARYEQVATTMRRMNQVIVQLRDKVVDAQG